MIDTPMATDPNSGAGNFRPISRMAGDDGSGAGASGPTGPSGSPMSAGGDPQAALAAVTETIRGIDSAIESISSQFPEASQESRRARDAVRALMMRIVANPGGAEPAAPSGPLG